VHGLSPDVDAGDVTGSRLVGLERGAIVKAMQDFRSGQRAGTVMDRIAKGFTDDEVQAIAAWYAAQR
jgi:sulfide dehydrogenase cytochrome subunit